LVLPDCIGATITRHGALVRSHRLVSIRYLHDVVLHKRVGGPAIDGKDSNA
jgi:hypothetical protein